MIEIRTTWSTSRIVLHELESAHAVQQFPMMETHGKYNRPCPLVDFTTFLKVPVVCDAAVGLGETEKLSSVARGTMNILQLEHNLEELDEREGCNVDAEAFVEARAVEPAVDPKVPVELDFMRLWEYMRLGRNINTCQGE